jgi:D-3-phosphoglycerate dehydrogenase
MNRHDVIICEDIWGEPFEVLSRELSVLAEPQLWSDRSRLRSQLRSAKALVVRNQTTVDADLLDAAPELLVVARAGVGLDNIDVRAAHERGVTVVAPRAANARSVAEYTVGAALALVRELITHDRSVRAGRWDRHAGHELAGRTWGIIGAGATGIAVARLVRNFGMTVIGYDPHVDVGDRAVVAAAIQLLPLDLVCVDAEIISIHVPATTETTGLIGSRLLKLMGSDTVLINVGRGEVIDEDALADALENGELAGAALDVRASEPPTVGRLEQISNVLLTPHIAGITEESQARIATALVEDIRSLLSGGHAAFAVTKDYAQHA